MTDTRPWVRERDQNVWHNFSNGHFEKALCGLKPIPGSPFVTDDVREINEFDICESCSNVFSEGNEQ